MNVTDSGSNGVFYGDEEFVKNNVNSGNSCAYDANGNRLYDSNSNVWGIKYNILNLPDAMQFYQGHQTIYTYSADGTKLKVVDKTAPAGAELPVTSLNTILTNPSVAMTTTTDYVGNMIYENGALKRILTPAGYWQNGIYYYFLKDHLGSNRVVITGSGAVVESSSFYPSGMRFGESAINGGSVQPYRHTGLEMQAMHGLNWIDNNARFRTVSDGGGFTGMDPLAEKDYSISPYAYCGGNPVIRIDPTGLEAWSSTHTDENGEVIDVFDDGDLEVYKHDGVGAAAKEDDDKNHSSTNTSAGGEWMGETAYWDEFVDRYHNGILKRNADGSYKPYKNYNISFDDDDTWDDDISRYFSMSGLFNILDLALESSPNGFFDLKSHTSNIGKKLNGKYATAESAGNYLAGLNAASRVGFDLYMRLAGSVHVNGNSKLALINSFIGKEYGTYPWYGEINYCTRRVMEGWLANPKANDRSAVLQRYRLNNINR